MSKYLLFFQNNNKSNLIDSLPTRNLISTHTIANTDQFYSRIDIRRNDIYFMSSCNIASLKETGEFKFANYFLHIFEIFMKTLISFYLKTWQMNSIKKPFQNHISKNLVKAWLASSIDAIFLPETITKGFLLAHDMSFLHLDSLFNKCTFSFIIICNKIIRFQGNTFCSESRKIVKKHFLTK